MTQFTASFLALCYAGELITDLGIAQPDQKTFDLIASGTGFLPRLSLQTSNSEKCKTGEFPVNHFALTSGSDMKDLGKEVDVLIISWRAKAVDMSGDPIISSYVPSSDTFQQISAKADTKDSNCMFGPEYLVYIPSEKKYATFFFGSKSARRESSAAQALLTKAATCKAKHIKTEKYAWSVATCIACSTPFDIPPIEEIREQAQKFLNPPAPEVEKAPDASTDRAR